MTKHSGAKHATVRLHFREQEANLQVEDDGCGFEPSVAAMSRRPSWGLLGMQERAALLSGQFSLHTSPGHGTRVEVVIPYQGAEEAE